MQTVIQKKQKKFHNLAQTAIKKYTSKKLSLAGKSAKQLLSAACNDANLYFQTGVAAHNAGDFENAIQLQKKALQNLAGSNVQEDNVRRALGMSLEATGSLEAALSEYDKGLEVGTQKAKLLNNRAILLTKLGNKQEALQNLKDGFAEEPSNTNILLNLANFLADQGNETEALALLKKNELANSRNAHFYSLLGKLEKDQKPLSAMVRFRRASHLQPDNPVFLNQYAAIFAYVQKVSTFDGLENDLLMLLSHDKVQWKKLSRIIPNHIKSSEAYQKIQPILRQNLKGETDKEPDFGVVTQVITDNVFLAALKRIRIMDPELEKLLEIFRRQTLIALSNNLVTEKPLQHLLLKILIPVAQYCFSSEFILVENGEEKNILDEFITGLNSTKHEPTHLDLLKFVITCCYIQPHKNDNLVSFAQRIKSELPEDLKNLVRLVIDEPLTERKIIKQIKQLTPIHDSISLSVQEQYEENPYPRWQHLAPAQPKDYKSHISSIIPSSEIMPTAFPQGPDVLIAGCGTGQQPISSALAYPSSNFTAIDLSLASMAYAIRKSKELKVTNINYGQADIMELGRLGRKFDVIECAGVLHHMHDPMVGWQTLCNILEDHGYMLIGLYSELGRQDVVAARQFIADNSYGTDSESIKRCRQSLFSLENDSLERHVIYLGDFYTTSACRDLIFHIQEHRFTIPRIKESLNKLGLEFLCFKFDENEDIKRYKSMFPEDEHLTDLDNWNLYEEKYPRTFSTMYKFWVRKKRF